MSVTATPFKGKTSHLMCKILSYDKLVYENDWQSIMHTHPYCEILIVTKGKGFILSNKDKHPVHCGQAAIINPFIHHTETPLQSNPVPPFNYVSIALDDIYFFKNNDLTALNEILFVDAAQIQETLNQSIAFLDDETERKNEYWETVSCNIIENIVISLMRIADLNNFHSAQSIPINKTDSIVETAKRYIEQNYSFDLSIENLSEKLFICNGKICCL